jgi:hypothetical protein
MGKPMTPSFIRSEIEGQSYEISLHADDERIAEGLTISQLEVALSDCKIIEEYPGSAGRKLSCIGLYNRGNTSSCYLRDESLRTSDSCHSLYPNHAKMEGSVYKEPIRKVPSNDKKI